jgi:hypothetical protein
MQVAGVARSMAVQPSPVSCTNPQFLPGSSEMFDLGHIADRQADFKSFIRQSVHLEPDIEQMVSYSSRSDRHPLGLYHCGVGQSHL